MYKQLILIGYSGHAYVCLDIALNIGYSIVGYCEAEKKQQNPYNLDYLGEDFSRSSLVLLEKYDFFFGIGNNISRNRATDDILDGIKKNPISLIHSSAIISPKAKCSSNGILIMPNVSINSLAKIGKGVIINTGAIVEHECIIDDFAHIAPGAALAGNVKVGKRSFVGANAVIKQGIFIGDDVTIGAGTVVLRDVPNGATVIGNPGRIIKI
jgi:sugar O-acyltransferase (sialic acid O-acetyltransferase NeuD family)